jgi:hypothetical protein
MKQKIKRKREDTYLGWLTAIQPTSRWSPRGPYLACRRADKRVQRVSLKRALHGVRLCWLAGPVVSSLPSSRYTDWWDRLTSHCVAVIFFSAEVARRERTWPPRSAQGPLGPLGCWPHKCERSVPWPLFAPPSRICTVVRLTVHRRAETAHRRRRLVPSPPFRCWQEVRVIRLGSWNVSVANWGRERLGRRLNFSPRL